MEKAPHHRCLALISAPWPLFNRPSIQLGTLKAYLLRQFPDLAVETHHLYLQVAQGVGYPRYRQISQRTWLAETVYAALLHPQMQERAHRLFSREARDSPLLRKIDFDRLVREVAAASEHWLDSVDGSKWLLAGFSNSICQLTATLYFIRRLKARWPGLPVVLGGAGMVPAAGEDLRCAFPEIDFVVSGEGERPLAALVGRLRRGGGKADTPPPAKAPRSGIDPDAPRSEQLGDLGELPVPDYDDYFALLGTFPADDRFFPELSVEMSRGCWWRRKSAGGRAGCRFCNLNLQWRGYRSKTAAQMVAEVDFLTRRHRVLSVSFMDNALPPAGIDAAFAGLAGLKKDLAMFAEIRATTDRKTLETLHRAGVGEIQIGIEALSSRTLRRLNKGTRAIDNLEVMKHCQELGIASRSNLILEFPGSDGDDVAETLRNLEFAQWYRPLRAVSFWLGYGSTVWQRHRDYGLQAVFNHPNYAALFPEGALRRMPHMVQAYRGDRGRQRILWRPVRRYLAQWKRRYRALSENGIGAPLAYRDGRDFILIRERRIDQDPLTHRLTGMSRKIYLFCSSHRSLGSILARFSGVGEDRLRPFLEEMVAKRLMFEENDRYLSLAVRESAGRCGIGIASPDLSGRGGPKER